MFKRGDDKGEGDGERDEEGLKGDAVVLVDVSSRVCQVLSVDDGNDNSGGDKGGDGKKLNIGGHELKL